MTTNFLASVRRWLAVLVVGGTTVAADAAEFQKVIAGGSYTDLADFERFATRAKQSGVTHVRITDSLPWSRWQYDDPADPYPSWVISNPGLLKIAIPEALKRYIPSGHAERVMKILEQRSAILRKLGLKAAISCFDPSMLPEAVFADHPLWRGARVDHPARSRHPRWAPSIDNPEVLALYKEAMTLLLKRCPGIEVVCITTNDSGVGLDWSSGTYAGKLGNTLYRGRPMEARLEGFFSTLRAAATDAGATLDIAIKWTREPDPRRIARKLSAGMAIENFEGPDATPFQNAAGFEEFYYSPYHPVIGIPQPRRVLDGLVAAERHPAPRLVLNFGDRMNRDLYFDLYDRFRAEKQKPRTELEQLAFLRELAVARVGDEKADRLTELWQNVHESAPNLQMLNTGGYVTDLGDVQQRWLTRPFVPFPHELKPEEKDYYRKFLFQARSEADAENLADIQATVWSGWATKLFVYKIASPVIRRNRESAAIAKQLGDADLARRFEIFNCFLKTANAAIDYQAQLDRARRKPGFPDDPAWESETRIGWDHQLMMETARAEIDNTAVLIDLLGENPGQYLVLAPTKEEEDIRLLGPDIVEQLRKKLQVMNAHWEDYERLFQAAKER
jgi:hypothetical protein